jgi:hypothetical protein
VSTLKLQCIVRNILNNSLCYKSINRINILTPPTLTPRNEKVNNVTSDLEYDSQKVPQTLHHEHLILNIMSKNIPLLFLYPAGGNSLVLLSLAGK